MNKKEFIESLRAKLKGLPTKEVEERLEFYSEMIDDRIEDGLLEEQAVSAIGSVKDVAEQIIADIPFLKIAKQKAMPKRRLKAWEIVLLAVGSPIWLSLVIAVLAVIFSLYVSLWAVIVSLWEVFVSFVAGSFASIASCVIFFLQGNAYSAISLVGAGLVLAGLSVFAFFGCKMVTKGCAVLTKKLVVSMKKSFAKKEEE